MSSQSELRISDLVTPSIRELITASGSEFVRQLGIEVVREVVLGILCGRNLRDSTEKLTRKRLADLNLATLSLFIEGTSKHGAAFVGDLLEAAHKSLLAEPEGKAERWLSQWLLGLTGKALQNVLRDDIRVLRDYKRMFTEVCSDVAGRYREAAGELRGVLQIGSETKAELDWLWMAHLLTAIGAQTLTIRGSEKSAYGKLFEKLILGSLLHILGFKHIPPPNPYLDQVNRVFWLSSRDNRRESDATLICEKGKAARLDIGFIGRGNSEISLDKVTRFERSIELGQSEWYYAATIILVDRVGKGSRVEELAQRLGGVVIQMSASYWPKNVAEVLKDKFEFEHELLKMNGQEIGDYLKEQIRSVPLEDFVGLSEQFKIHYLKESAQDYSANDVDSAGEE